MRLAARIFLLLTGTLLLAHFLPAGYWLIADKHQRAPIVFFSCIEKRFLLFRSDLGDIRRTDASGKIYEREEFERLLPLDNYMQLYKDNRMPKEIDGVAITLEKLRRERVNVRLKPEALESPSVALTPLLESQSGRVRLEMPGDFMRLGNPLEFIDAKSNRVLAEKTALFEKAFKASGFVFPIRLTGGNPTTLKPYDEGYFLVDATGAFFQLRQVRGEPELKRITDLVASEEKALWAGLKPRYIHVQEQDNREVCAMIIGEEGDVHAVIGKDYRLVRLPLEGFNPETMQLSLRGDLFNRLLTVSSAEYVEAVVMNRDYAFVDRYTETLPARVTRPAGRLAATLFPFVLNFESDGSGYLGLHATPGSRTAIWLNVGILACVIGWWFARKQTLGRRVPELVAVAAGGVFGLILICVLPRAD